MSNPQLLAYLDHNVLDTLLKGDSESILGFLREAGLTPVFSSENLAEIHRSKGREAEFLALLDELGSLYLVPVVYSRGRHTGSAEFRQTAASQAYEEYLENLSASPDAALMFTGMLEKFFGGRKEESFDEIFSNGADELRKLMLQIGEGLDDIPGLDERQRSEVEDAIRYLPELLSQQFTSAATYLDSQQNAGIRGFEESTGLGAKVLKNVQGPNVVEKIWALIEERFEGMQGDIDTFFGVKPSPFEADAGEERALVEKINGLYHQLNFLGYFRDSKMHKKRRFKASFSDMTHAGLASFCHVLVCRDEDLVMKAAAAYEYLGVRTKIVHYKANK